MHPDHELVHGAAAVIAGDVGVQVEPHPLDAIALGAVRREEVEDESPAEMRERLERLLAGVNRGVVEDEVDTASAPVMTRQTPQQLDEEG